MMWGKKNAKDVIDADNEIEDDYRFYSGKKCTNKKNVCNNTKTKYIMVLFVGEPYRTS